MFSLICSLIVGYLVLNLFLLLVIKLIGYDKAIYVGGVINLVSACYLIGNVLLTSL